MAHDPFIVSSSIIPDAKFTAARRREPKISTGTAVRLYLPRGRVIPALILPFHIEQLIRRTQKYWHIRRPCFPIFLPPPLLQPLAIDKTTMSRFWDRCTGDRSRTAARAAPILIRGILIKREHDVLVASDPRVTEQSDSNETTGGDAHLDTGR